MTRDGLGAGGGVYDAFLDVIIPNPVPPPVPNDGSAAANAFGSMGVIGVDAPDARSTSIACGSFASSSSSTSSPRARLDLAPPRDFLVFRCSRNDALPPPNGGRAPSPTPPSRSSPPAAFKFSAGIISTETGETCSPLLCQNDDAGVVVVVVVVVAFRWSDAPPRSPRLFFPPPPPPTSPDVSGETPSSTPKARTAFGGVAVALASATTPPSRRRSDASLSTSIPGSNIVRCAPRAMRRREADEG
eukprot:31455-Pelagococcus_subviridis.AAC.6